MKKIIAIITGVNGEIGLSYTRHLLTRGINVIGIGRKERCAIGGIDYLCVNLLDKEQIGRIIQKIPFKDVEEILYFHLIGKFQFEDINHPIKDVDKDGIDDETYSTNYSTFINLIEPLIEKIREEIRQKNRIKLSMTAIGSISDKYSVERWQSFSKTKKILKERMREIVDRYYLEDQARATIINVSTVWGSQLAFERPQLYNKINKNLLYADEIVLRSINTILDRELHFCEKNIFKPREDFDYTIFTDLKKVDERWYKDMQTFQN
ncbi:MAG: hypothetical protein AABW56_02370 [Nanoarchaeota archaeon]